MTRSWISWFLAVLLVAFAPSGLAQQAGPSPAVTQTLCMACHRDRFEVLAGTPHRALDTPDWREKTGVQPVCINCHGDASAHIAAGGGKGSIFAFGADQGERIKETCLGCHASAHPDFDRSPHARAGLVCTDCHSQHRLEV